MFFSPHTNHNRHGGIRGILLPKKLQLYGWHNYFEIYIFGRIFVLWRWWNWFYLKTTEYNLNDNKLKKIIVI